LENRLQVGEAPVPTLAQPKPVSGIRLSVVSLTTSFIQGICVLAVGINAAKVILGITSVAASGGSAWIHSDPVRFGLRYLSLFLSFATLWVIWNGWRLRNRSAASWRKAPLARREKWSIAFGLLSSVISWILIVAEVFAHQKMHPR
jgi:hypothetical protein